MIIFGIDPPKKENEYMLNISDAWSVARSVRQSAELLRAGNVSGDQNTNNKIEAMVSAATMLETQSLKITTLEKQLAASSESKGKLATENEYLQNDFARRKKRISDALSDPLDRGIR